VRRASLIAVLLALPVAFTIHDLATGRGLADLGNATLDGLGNGAIWALIALGYTLVYAIDELINFAHGDLFMVGSFVSFSLYGTLGLTIATGPLGLIAGLAITLALAMVACATLNVLIERVGYKPLRAAPRLARLIVAVGFSFILRNVGFIGLGAFPRGIPDLVQTSHPLATVGGLQITNGDVLTVAVAAPLIVAVVRFMSATRLGRAIRATSQDPQAARLMGINVDTTVSATFLLAGLLAGAAGLVYGLYETSLWYFQGFEAGLIGFTAAVMGGLGNLWGAVLGGVAIGVLQQISDSRIGADWTPAIVFAYLIGVMVFAPRGLLSDPA
jgi:branched-chain amino acid transport system permease protein